VEPSNAADSLEWISVRAGLPSTTMAKQLARLEQSNKQLIAKVIQKA
jgi:lambda repressor-like predicted transcriptional regulator